MRARVAMVIVPLLLLVAASRCGSVSPVQHEDGGTGGAGGSSGAAGHFGSDGGIAGHPGAGGQAGGGVVGGGGAAGAACLPYNTTGFAYNVDNACAADGGRCLPTDPNCCYADCQINGAQFVGCAENAPGTVPSHCYPSCADCP